jgi:hypothetical protein
MTGTLRSSAASIDAHEIVGIIEAAVIVCIGANEPIFADQRDQRIASTDAYRKHFDEIAAGRNVVDVDEDAFAPEVAPHAVIDAAREPGRVFPTIADEDAASHAMRSSRQEN